jgi:hypothetical protein
MRAKGEKTYITIYYFSNLIFGSENTREDREMEIFMFTWAVENVRIGIVWELGEVEPVTVDDFSSVSLDQEKNSAENHDRILKVKFLSEVCLLYYMPTTIVLPLKCASF